MRILGIENMTGPDLANELDRGGRFVIYEYAVSLLVVSFKRGSNIHFIRGGKSRVPAGLGCCAVSLLFGWWGIPWGPIYTIGSFITNLRGGKDVTNEVLALLQQGS